MALQELSPMPQPSGLTNLGATIAAAGADYLHRSRQLQDVASERQWLASEGDKQRQEKLVDQKDLESFRSRQAGIQILINEGYLDGSQRDDQQAVAQAFHRAQADGLTKLYVELMQTPDENGKPLLTVEQAADPAAVQAAKDKFGVVKAKQVQFQLGQQGNAQETVDTLAQQLAQHQGRISQISAKLDQPAKQYAINDPEVHALAIQLAEQNKQGSGRNREAVAQMIPLAQKQLNDQATLQHMQDVQAATRQLDGERYAEAAVTQALDHVIGTSKVYPRKAAALSPAMLQTGAPAQAPKVATATDIAAAMRSVVGTPPAAAPAAAQNPLSPIDNPTNDPTIEAGNQEIQRQKAASVQAELNDAITEGKTIDDQLSSVREGFTQPLPPALQLSDMPAAPARISPIMAAHSAASLLKAKADNAAKVRALQAQLLGPSAALVAPPADNTQLGSTPSVGAAEGAPPWWKTANAPEL